MHLSVFNRLLCAAARDLLRACMDVERWSNTMVRARPYPEYDLLLEVARDAAYPLTPVELEAAITQHLRHRRASDAGPRDHARGDAAAQHGRGPRYVALSEEYERTFGRPFIVRAAGRSAAEVLGLLTTRLSNSVDTEEAVVAAQLRQISLLALTRRISA